MIYIEVKNTYKNEDEPKEKEPEKIEFEIMNGGFDYFEENYLNQVKRWNYIL